MKKHNQLDFQVLVDEVLNHKPPVVAWRIFGEDTTGEAYDKIVTARTYREAKNNFTQTFEHEIRKITVILLDD